MRCSLLDCITDVHYACAECGYVLCAACCAKHVYNSKSGRCRRSGCEWHCPHCGRRMCSINGTKEFQEKVAREYENVTLKPQEEKHDTGPIVLPNATCACKRKRKTERAPCGHCGRLLCKQNKKKHEEKCAYALK